MSLAAQALTFFSILVQQTPTSLQNDYGNNGCTINGGDGNDRIYSIGNSNNIYGDNGDDEIYSIGTNNTINGGAGNNTIVSIGDSNNVGAADGNNTFAFWGNSLTAKFGNGNNNIYTLDKAMAASKFVSFADYFQNRFVSNNRINGLNNINITVGSGANYITGTINDGAHLYGFDNTGGGNNVFIHGGYSL